MFGGGAQPQVSPAFEVFLSSTIEDWREIRLALRDYLRAMHEVSCPLPEHGDWDDCGHEHVPTECQRRIEQRASAFFLLLGHRYGSIPPGLKKSITHLEYETALRQRNIRGLRMGVVIPDGGLDEELKGRSEPLLAKLTVRARQQDSSRLKKFRDQFDTSWKLYHRIDSRENLIGWVASRCRDWNGETPLAAAQGRVKAKGCEIPPEQLGRLGRRAQLAAVDDIVSELDRTGGPGAALLVSGDENAGHKEFLEALRQHQTFRKFRKTPPVGCRVGEFSLELLCQRIHESLGRKDLRADLSPVTLAESIASQLQTESIWLIFRRVNELEGGVAGFRERFWLPFHGRLLELQRPDWQRVIAVISVEAPREPAWDAAIKTDPGDFARLAPVRELSDFGENDVMQWLAQEQDHLTLSERRAITAAVFRNSQGQHDGTPLRVFNRLKGRLE